MQQHRQPEQQQQQLQTRFYVKQRRVNVKFVHPWDMLQFYKDRYGPDGRNIPSLESPNIPVHELIETDNAILRQNIKMLDELKAKGKVPGEDPEIMEEVPEIHKYIAKVKQPAPEFGKDYKQGYTKRSAVIALKAGMYPVFDEFRQEIVLTALWIPNCHVLQVKTMEKEGLTALQLGAGTRKLKRVTKPMLGHFQKAGVEPKHAIIQVPVTPDAIIPIGTEITARHFLPGQFVDVTGRTVGKGFQGPMKRWGFRGQPATHGTSLTHRAHGSIGQRTLPGRVFKGKKMAGHMGFRKKTIPSLWLYMIDFKHNILFVKGSVPGKNGSYVLVKDAVRKKFTAPPPMPTFYPPPGEDITSLDDVDCVLIAKQQMPAYLRDAEKLEDEIKKERAKLKKTGKTAVKED